MHAYLESTTPEYVYVCGNLDFDSIAPLLQAGYEKINATQRVLFDWGNVEHSNTAGIALLLAWVRYAHARNIVLHIKKFPDFLWAFASISGIRAWLETLLAVE